VQVQQCAGVQEVYIGMANLRINIILLRNFVCVNTRSLTVSTRSKTRNMYDAHARRSQEKWERWLIVEGLLWLYIYLIHFRRCVDCIPQNTDWSMLRTGYSL